MKKQNTRPWINPPSYQKSKGTDETPNGWESESKSPSCPPITWNGPSSPKSARRQVSSWISSGPWTGREVIDWSPASNHLLPSQPGGACCRRHRPGRAPTPQCPATVSRPISPEVHGPGWNLEVTTETSLEVYQEGGDNGRVCCN